jgi:GAF domain-containing protein
MLVFAYPPELAAGGTNIFPLSLPSVASRVVHEGASVCSNQATEERHLGFYERVAVEGLRPTPIHKLLAAPLRGPGTGVLGVVEISRRGERRLDAGPDFGPDDARTLERLAALAAAALAA